MVASAGDDNKISLWHKNGQNMGMVPLSKSDIDDDIEESITSINFSNKGSRYLCSGGSGHIVRIWDLQRKRCIKWLSGHTDTISGVMYNCKDEHLASVSIKGDIILHNLASGALAAELKDPNEQPLRVLDYSRISRHMLVTAGDDGSVHLWDTTGRSPKVSWLKQHSAPTTGLCFSPSSDKIIASVGLDKKLYTFDSASRKPTFCTPYEAPLSSLAYSDDGNILAAGTNNGRIVFYDLRGKPQPFTVLRAYNSSEAVTSICWQRSKPVIVNENNCTAEMAILGGSCDDSVLMPDPMRSLPTSSFPATTAGLTSRSSLPVNSSGSLLSTSYPSTADETPNSSRVRAGGSLSKLRAPHSSYNFKDDMDVFSPLVDVQPITPSLGNWWDDHDGARKDTINADKKSSLFASTVRRFPFTEGNIDHNPISDWRTNLIARQEESPVPDSTAANVASSKSDSSSSVTPPEAWGGNALSDKFNHRQSVATLSRFLPPVSAAPASSIFSASSGNLELPGAVPSAPLRRSTYAERMSTTFSFADGIGSTLGSPKSKKTGSETREDLINSFLSRQGTTATTGTGNLPATDVGVASQQPRTLSQPIDQQQGSSFSLQLVQRTLEESLGSVQKSIHEDVRSLHIELLRQFHLQEMEMANLMSGVLEKQEELMKEVQLLRRENQQLRQLL